MKKINSILLLAYMTLTANGWAASSQPVEITVHRSPTCSCCEKWVAHLKANNFNAKDIVTDDMQAIKNKLGVTAQMSSCHTAVVNGYVVEGHVPANDIKQLLKIKPSVLGISVPGMPMGTPGMEMGDRRDAYDVLSFDEKQQAKVFNSYQAN